MMVQRALLTCTASQLSQTLSGLSCAAAPGCGACQELPIVWHAFGSARSLPGSPGCQQTGPDRVAVAIIAVKPCRREPENRNAHP